MNNKGLEQFFNKMAEDPAIQTHVKSISGDMDALAAYAVALGYDVSAEDVRTYTDKAMKILTAKLQVKAVSPAAAESPGAQAFFSLTKLADSDESIAKRLEELSVGTAEELIAYGAEQGFTFSKQDLLAIGENILEPSDELSDEELELAAGGTSLLCAATVLAFASAAALAGGAVIGAGVTGAVVGFVALLGK